MICDNINNCHDNIVINEEHSGIRVRCKLCGEINVLRKDIDGRFNNREYAKIFKRDIVQVGTNLYYKIHPDKMSIC